MRASPDEAPASPGSDVDVDEEALNAISLRPQPVPPVRDDDYAQASRHSGADDDGAALLAEEEDGAVPIRLARRRSSFSRYSFDFGRSLLIPPSVDIEPREHVERNLGLMSGGQIGSGIFSTSGIIVSDVGSVGCALLVWIFAGFLAWTGAATYAELGSAIPLNGGTQAYLNYSYGPLVAYLFSWQAIVGSMPGSAAAISLATSEYVCRILYHTAFTADSEESARNIPMVIIKLVALVVLALAGVLVGISNRVSYRVQTGLTAIKLLSLLAITVLGIMQAARGRASTSLRSAVFTDSATSPGAYAVALYSALFAYSGWDYICYVAAEMSDPGRDLPRIVHTSMGTTMTLYLLANISYFVVLEKQSVAHSNTVGLDFGKALFGPLGGTLFALAIALATFGALHSLIAALSRLYAVAGKDGYIPARFGELHPRTKTPLNAIALYILIAGVYILVGSFKTLVTTFGICVEVFYFLSAISLLVLRAREPLLDRPYRTVLAWPLIFCGVAIFLLLMPIVAVPVQFFAAAAIILSGLPGYYLIRRREKLSFERFYSALPSFGSRPPRRRESSNGSLHVSKEPGLPRVSEADEEDE